MALEGNGEIPKENKRRIENERHISNLLNDLKKVGSQKPLGYLPVNVLDKYGINLQELLEELHQKGVQTMISSESEMCSSPFLYAYDEKALDLLLSSNKSILENANWPTDPDSFVLKVSQVRAKSPSDLFDLIADAFADYNNSLRQNRK